MRRLLRSIPLIFDKGISTYINSQPQPSFKCYYFRIVWRSAESGSWSRKSSSSGPGTEPGKGQTESQVTRSNESCKECAPRTYVLYWFFTYRYYPDHIYISIDFTFYTSVIIRTSVLCILSFNFCIHVWLYQIFINQDTLNKTKSRTNTTISLSNWRYFNCGVRTGEI